MQRWINHGRSDENGDDVAKSHGIVLLLSHLDLALVHLSDQSIDLVLSVPQITTLHEVLELPRSEPSGRIAQLEGPQEVARLLEIGPHGEDLMDEILHAHDPVFPQIILDDLVVGEGDTLLVDLAVATLVDEFADGLEVGVTVGDVGFDNLEHFRGGFREADEDAVVDLEETEELERFAGFGGHFRDTENYEYDREAGAASRGGV